MKDSVKKITVAICAAAMSLIDVYKRQAIYRAAMSRPGGVSAEWERKMMQ